MQNLKLKHTLIIQGEVKKNYEDKKEKHNKRPNRAYCAHLALFVFQFETAMLDTI